MRARFASCPVWTAKRSASTARSYPRSHCPLQQCAGVVEAVDPGEDVGDRHTRAEQSMPVVVPVLELEDAIHEIPRDAFAEQELRDRDLSERVGQDVRGPDALGEVGGGCRMPERRSRICHEEPREAKIVL